MGFLGLRDSVPGNICGPRACGGKASAPPRGGQGREDFGLGSHRYSRPGTQQQQQAKQQVRDAVGNSSISAWRSRSTGQYCTVQPGEHLHLHHADARCRWAACWNPREQPAAPSVQRPGIIYSPWTVDVLVHRKVLSVLCLLCSPIQYRRCLCLCPCPVGTERRNKSQGWRGGTE